MSKKSIFKSKTRLIYTLACTLSLLSFWSCSKDEKTPPPTVISLTPNQGIIGSSITISGENFSADITENTVLFSDDIEATITEASRNSLTVTVPNNAKTGKVTVITNDKSANSEDEFIVIPTPIITSFSPISGLVNTSVTITGTNFSSVIEENTVRFNNKGAIITNATTTSLTVTVPNEATTGKISVIVNDITGTSTNDFKVIHPPTITSFTPNEGFFGTTIIIKGENFSTTANDNKVFFNDNKEATVTNATATELTVTVPYGAESGKINVTVNDITVISANDFTVTYPLPTITSFSPTEGAIETEVIITGTNFSTIVNENIVTFNNNKRALLTNISENSITAIVPQGATTGKINLSVNGVEISTTEDFTVTHPAPIITLFSPTNGIPGDEIIINGANFSPIINENTVIFNDNKEAVILDANPNSLKVIVPDDAVTGKISVTVNNNTTTSTNDFNATATPTITSFSPTSASPGATVTINGTNFSNIINENEVVFSDSQEATITNATVNTLTVIVPNNAETGNVTVTVNGITTTSNTNFIVSQQTPTPTINSFSPTTGNIGTTVTITGTNFSTNIADNTVKFSNNKIATITNATANTLTVTVPDGAITGKISLTVNGTTVDSNDEFTVTQPTPTINSFSPTTGMAGTTVTINGTNFSTNIADNTVKFSNNKIATITNATANTLTVTVPDGAITGKISLTVNGTTVDSNDEFTVTQPTPTINSFSPTTGMAGTTVTINGTNFSTNIADNTVKFSNNKIATITNATTNTLTVTVPNGAITGNIEVIVNGITITSNDQFIIAPTMPTIISFSPMSAQVGSTITINGTNFSATPTENIVTFYNNIEATVTNASPNTLTVTVPQGAESGKINVTVNGVTVTSNDNFIVEASTLSPCAQNMELGPNESCSITFDSGNSITFTVNNDGTACFGSVCNDVFIYEENVERCYTNFLAAKTNGKWLIGQIPEQKATIGGGCAQCEGDLPDSCLTNYTNSGSVTATSGTGGWQFKFGSTSSSVFGTDSNGNQRQLYFLYNEDSNLDLSPFSSGLLEVTGSDNPGIKIYLLIGLPSFTGEIACNKDLSFAFLARSPYEILERQNPTFQTYKGEDFCNTIVSLNVQGY